MSLYYTPNVHRSHSSRENFDNDPLRNGQQNPSPRRHPPTQERSRQRQREASPNDSMDPGSIFIFPQLHSPASPPLSSSQPSPRSPYSEDSIISRPAHRRRTTSHLSHVSQSEPFVDLDGISTPTTITLSIESSPGSAFTDVGEDERSVEDRRIEATLWDWGDDVNEGAIDGPGGELRRNSGGVCPNGTLRANYARRPRVRPWPLQHGSGERLRALIEREQLRNRWRDTSRSQRAQQSSSRSYSPLSTPSSTKEADLLSLAPHPRIKIPFLDFFASILAVDESTVDLITRCSTVEIHGSVLFPGHAVQPLLAPTSHPITDEDGDLFSTVVPAMQEGDERTAIHGFHRALLSSGVERDSWTSLKEGLAVFYNTTPSVPTLNPGRLLGLAQLWGLVSHACARGGNVLGSVYSSTHTAPSGVEETKQK